MSTAWIMIACILLLQPSKQNWEQEDKSTPYCGVYCVYAIANHFNVKLSFPELLKFDYISHYLGSTNQDLLRALDSLNIQAKFSTNLDIDFISSLNHPAILHVRSATMKVAYMHWLLFLGSSPDGRFAVYDPPRGRYTLTAGELLAIWDGHGIVVSAQADKLPRKYFSWQSLWAIMLSFSIVFLIRSYNIKFPFRLLFAGVASAIIWQLFSPVAFWKNSEGTGIVQSAHFDSVIPIIDQVDKGWFSVHTNRPILVDCRLKNAYDHAHIPNAIHLPVDSNFGNLLEFMRRYPKDKQLVLYCQSEGCAWADIVGNFLILQGYQQICIYRPGFYGYEEWKKSQP